MGRQHFLNWRAIKSWAVTLASLAQAGFFLGAGIALAATLLSGCGTRLGTAADFYAGAAMVPPQARPHTYEDTPVPSPLTCTGVVEDGIAYSTCR